MTAMDDSIGQVVELYKEHGLVFNIISLISIDIFDVTSVISDFGIIP